MLSKIAELNDQLRQNLFTPGLNRVFVSATVKFIAISGMGAVVG